ncbi:hypothetical protein L228DRAFT_96018 [Xylona heveae TC161]|uniref:Uncharacterized protein n=1 Tax=Xylona heveae (strain CBS 132557 / TC161) TaxID=1328760 RepID=A0A165I5I3_XYLHT|nr:hypothetical protein L228DRAFT_96018 [Xylona heveae TC161]KZF24414.1 hypothetical protein L228DRAFT_96018 [Xylona heveae TC161]
MGSLLLTLGQGLSGLSEIIRTMKPLDWLTCSGPNMGWQGPIREAMLTSGNLGHLLLPIQYCISTMVHLLSAHNWPLRTRDTNYTLTGHTMS